MNNKQSILVALLCLFFSTPNPLYSMEQQHAVSYQSQQINRIKKEFYTHIASCTFSQAFSYINQYQQEETTSEKTFTNEELDTIKRNLYILISKAIAKGIEQIQLTDDSALTTKAAILNAKMTLYKEIISSYTILDYAIEYNDPLTYTLIMAAGIEYQDNLHGLRLLHLAISKGNIALVTWLLEQTYTQRTLLDTLLNLRDVQNRTPLDYACALRHYQCHIPNLDLMIAVLQEHGACKSC